MSPMQRDDELLDIAQAAAFLKVSETSLRRWTNSGLLPHLRVGGRRERRFRRSVLIAFMEDAGPVTGVAEVGGDTDGHAMVDGVAVAHGSHFCGFYTSELGRVHLTVRFLSGGLRPGSACILVSSKKMRDSVLEELKQTHPSLKDQIKAGLLLPSDYSDSSDVQIEHYDRVLRRAQAGGAESLRLVGDVGEFAERVPGGIVNYENDYTRFIAKRFPVVTLCTYDVRKFSGGDIYRVLKVHPDSCRHSVERWMA